MDNKDYINYIKNVLTSHIKNRFKGYGIKILLIGFCVLIFHIIFPTIKFQNPNLNVFELIFITSFASLIIFFGAALFSFLLFCLFAPFINITALLENIILFNYPFVKKMTNNKFNFIKNDIKSKTIYIPSYNDYIEYKYNPIDFINSYSSIIPPLISKAVEDYDSYIVEKNSEQKIKEELNGL